MKQNKELQKINLINKKIPDAAKVFFTLLAIEISYEFLIQQKGIAEIIWLAPFLALLYSITFAIIFRYDITRTSICYLSLPYMIFFPGWLDTEAAIAMTLIFSYCLYRTFKLDTPIKIRHTHYGEFLAFTTILIWVNLSGAGGYGYQTSDYTISNGRLLDLINHSWPVHYGPDQNFIYYIGYFLPSAVIGKIFGYNIGMQSMFLWTVIGVSIAIRWMSTLSGWKLSAPLVIAFIFFGPMDFFGSYYVFEKLNAGSYENSQNTLLEFFNKSTDNIDFWTSIDSGFFIGNFLSNSFQLYWSPQQAIAGWICAGMLMHIFLKEKFEQFIFIFILLALWAPMAMIAIIPIVIGVIFISMKKDWRSIITFENTIGAGSILLLFMIFYSAGSIAKHPSYWIFEAKKPDEIFLLFIFSFGIYLVSITPSLKTLEHSQKIWLALLAVSFIALPLKTYGEYNDLLCRGSAPLMFLLLVFLLKNIKACWEDNKVRSFALIALLAIGTSSAIMQNRDAITRYGITQPIATVISYPNAYPNLGDDNNIFQKYLARKK
ncbi:MAG: hypothetical protein KAY78_01110 [Pseudomonadales bacterium]|nr:hypothetical protein [Pseudomonadales bacterium]